MEDLDVLPVILAHKPNGRLTHEDIIHLRDKGYGYVADLAERTGRAYEYTSDSAVTIGEYHIRYVAYPEEETKVMGYLERAEIIIVEDNSMEDLVGYTSFINIAINFAKSHNIELVVLEQNLRGKYYDAWKNVGSTLTFREFLIAKIIELSQISYNSGSSQALAEKFVNKLLTKEIPEGTGVEDLQDLVRYIGNYIYRDLAEGIKTNLNLLTSVVADFETAKLRDLEFHRLVSDIRERSEGKYIVAVVGEAHTIEVVRGLEGTEPLSNITPEYITAFDKLIRTVVGSVMEEYHGK